MHLDDLPDYPLLTILSYLDASSLYEMSKVCERFNQLILLNRFWKNIDARRLPNTPGKIDYCLKRINKNTTKLKFKAIHQCEILFDGEFLKILTISKHLTILVLENQKIDDKIMAKYLPETLIELSLKRTQIQNGRQFFRFSAKTLKNLKVLLVDECDWFETCALIPIAKYQNLLILSIYGCRHMTNSIAYFSLASQLGFQKLRIFDARLSTIGPMIIKHFHKNQQLQAIYLQNLNSTYKLDYYLRKYDIKLGFNKPYDQYFRIEDEYYDDINDDFLTNNQLMDGGLNDDLLIGFLDTISLNINEDMPDSELYQDPYKYDCLCDNNLITNQMNELPMNLMRLVERTKLMNDVMDGVVRERADENEPPIRCRQCGRADRQRMERTNRKRALDDLDVDGGADDDDGGAGPSQMNQTNKKLRTNDGLMIVQPMKIRNFLVNINHPGVLINNDVKLGIGLRRLALRGFRQVTDVTLTYLRHLDLNLLDVTYTSVTIDGLRKYLEYHPDCRIIHEDFCKCRPRLSF